MTVNIIETVLQAMQDGDSDTEDQSARLMAIWDNATTAEQGMLDDVFVCLCGWSLETIINGEAR